MEKLLKELNFENVYESEDEIVFEYNPIYKHKEQGLNFDYKYGVGICFDVEYDNIVRFNITMFPMYKSLSKQAKLDVALDFADDFTAKELNEIYNVHDATLAGYDLSFELQEIKLSEQEIENFDIDNFIKEKKILETALEKINQINGLFGFYMDAIQYYKWTGWDYIKWFTKNIKMTF